MGGNLPASAFAMLTKIDIDADVEFFLADFEVNAISIKTVWSWLSEWSHVVSELLANLRYPALNNMLFVTTGHSWRWALSLQALVWVQN